MARVPLLVSFARILSKNRSRNLATRRPPSLLSFNSCVKFNICDAKWIGRATPAAYLPSFLPSLLSFLCSNSQLFAMHPFICISSPQDKTARRFHRASIYHSRWRRDSPLRAVSRHPLPRFLLIISRLHVGRVSRLCANRELPRAFVV